MSKVSKESLQLQAGAAGIWNGSCERLSDISIPTLVITGTQDITSPAANSLRLAEKIPGAWLCRQKEWDVVLETFLAVT